MLKPRIETFGVFPDDNNIDIVVAGIDAGPAGGGELRNSQIWKRITVK